MKKLHYSKRVKANIKPVRKKHTRKYTKEDVENTICIAIYFILNMLMFTWYIVH